MLIGLLFALGACLLWGTIFVIPQFLPEFSSMEVALGRYVFFGLFSLVLLLTRPLSYPMKTWRKAFTFGLVANVVYYVGVVVGVRYATPPLAVLVVGMCPIMAAIYANWQSRQFPFRRLLLPCLVMTMGIVLVNVMEIDWSFTRSSLKEYLIGMSGSMLAMVTWSWYAVQNANFLKSNPKLPRTDWATMIGVSTLFWVVILGAFCSLGPYRSVDLQKFLHFNPELIKFYGCTAFMGIACAWLGCYLWNKASTFLPMALMGPFIMFETLFGLLFVFLYDYRLPSLIEFLGMSAMFVGISLCHSLHRKQVAFE